MNEQETHITEAIAILEGIYDELLANREIWDIAEAPDGHSFAWHGSNILQNAKDYLLHGYIKTFDAYQPIYTR